MTTLADDDVEAERMIGYDRVAQRLDCSPATVRRMANRGQFIPPMLVGNMWRWRARDIDLWIKARAEAQKKIEAAAAKAVAPQKRARRG
jgi:predicted DNA-binding transcriptional regulator AlpA